MKRSWCTGILTLAIVLAGRASGQEPQEEVLFPTDWKVGDKLEIVYVRGGRKTMRGRLGPENETRTSVTLEIKGRSKEGYSARWTIGETLLTQGGKPTGKNPVMNALASFNRGIAYDISLDARGTPDRLLNEDEVRKKLTSTLERLEQGFVEMGISQTQATSFLKSVEPLVKNTGIVALNEPSVFMFACGHRLTAGKPLEYDEFLPNPLGGQPFPAKGRIVLKKVDRKEGLAEVEGTLSLEPKKTREILLEVLTRMAKAAGRKPPTEKDVGPVTIDDRTVVVMNLKTGWHVSVDYRRRTQMGISSDRRYLRFQTLEPEKR